MSQRTCAYIGLAALLAVSAGFLWALPDLIRYERIREM